MRDNRARLPEVVLNRRYIMFLLELVQVGVFKRITRT